MNLADYVDFCATHGWSPYNKYQNIVLAQMYFSDLNV